VNRAACSVRLPIRLGQFHKGKRNKRRVVSTEKGSFQRVSPNCKAAKIGSFNNILYCVAPVLVWPNRHGKVPETRLRTSKVAYRWLMRFCRQWTRNRVIGKVAGITKAKASSFRTDF